MKKGTTSPGSIEVVQTRVVGKIEVGGGSQDPLILLAEIAMKDAVETFRGDTTSTSVYEVDTKGSLDMGKIAVTIEHDPHGDRPMTVDEAKQALNDARRYEREGKEMAIDDADWNQS
jgi:hypothetical protein